MQLTQQKTLKSKKVITFIGYCNLFIATLLSKHHLFQATFLTKHLNGSYNSKPVEKYNFRFNNCITFVSVRYCAFQRDYFLCDCTAIVVLTFQKRVVHYHIFLLCINVYSRIWIFPLFSKLWSFIHQLQSMMQFL